LGKSGVVYIKKIKNYDSKTQRFSVPRKDVFCANKCPYNYCQFTPKNPDKYAKAEELLQKCGSPQKDDPFNEFALIKLEEVLEQREEVPLNPREMRVYSPEELEILARYLKQYRVWKKD